MSTFRRPLLAVILEWPIRRVLGPVLDMFASLDEAYRDAREDAGGMPDAGQVGGTWRNDG